MINALSSVSWHQSLQSTAAKPAKLPTGTYNQDLSDKVSISSAAQEMLAAEKSPITRPRTLAQENLLNGLSNAAPGIAEQRAEEMAMANTGILYDISDERGTHNPNGIVRPPGVRKLTSGKIVDQAYTDRLESEISSVDAKMRALYTAEKSKGATPVEIMGKLFDLINAQSQDYLEATGWGEFKNRAAT